MTLGPRLKQAREDAGLKQNELAKRSAVTQATVSRIETGAMERPSADVLRRVAQALGVSMDWLLTGERIVDPTAEVSPRSEPVIPATGTGG